jgi:hypothetical protein
VQAAFEAAYFAASRCAAGDPRGAGEPRHQRDRPAPPFDLRALLPPGDGEARLGERRALRRAPGTTRGLAARALAEGARIAGRGHAAGGCDDGARAGQRGGGRTRLGNLRITGTARGCHEKKEGVREPLTLTLAVIQAGLQQVCNEMDIAFSRAAFSPVIAEADDRSDGIYAAEDGALIAQGEAACRSSSAPCSIRAGHIIRLIREGASRRRSPATSTSSTTPISAARI